LTRFSDSSLLVLVIVALVFWFGLTTERFFSAATAQALASQAPPAILLAAGMTIVLIAGGIDLSVGSVLGLSGAILGHLMVVRGWPAEAAVPGALATGLAIGVVNGLATVAFRVPSFIVTLGTLEIARAAAYLVTDSRTLYVGPGIEGMASASMGGVPVSFVLAVALAAGLDLVLRRTVFGRRLVAVGDSVRAVWASGVDPRPIQVASFAVSGLLASLAAVLQTSRLGAADPNAGVGFELAALAAAVVGGTSLLGGRGSALGSLLGVVVMAVLATGLAQGGASEPTKRLVTGLVIVAAVAADALRRRAQELPDPRALLASRGE
jgi:ribose transport system permease protein